MVLLRWGIGCREQIFFEDKQVIKAVALSSLPKKADVLEIRRCSQELIFVLVISRAEPEAIIPWIITDAVDMANGSRGKGINRRPALTAIAAAVDMHLSPLGVVPVFTKDNQAIAADCQGHRTAAARDGKGAYRHLVCWTLGIDALAENVNLGPIGEHAHTVYLCPQGALS